MLDKLPLWFIMATSFNNTGANEMKFEPALEQELTCREMAVARVNSAIRHYDSMGVVENDNQIIAGMVADIMHYCNQNNVDFQSVIDEAEMFVSEDESIDAELVK
jgi:hypothetical protein